jgi:transcriptional regulator with PAS, ATPase and Fis domain
MNLKEYKVIADFKKSYLKDELLNPFDCPYISPEIAENWIINRQAKVNPEFHAKGMYIELKGREQREIISKYKTLIEITTPIFNSFKPQPAVASKYQLFLSEPSGVTLKSVGASILVPHSDNQANKIFYEKIGNTATSLAIKYDKPFQLLGIEHFSYAYEKIFAVSSPIHDIENKVIAALSYTCEMDIDSQLKESEQSSLLGMVTALTKVIEAQLKAQADNALLKSANQKLSSIFNLMDTGLLLFDKNNYIFLCNEKALSLLQVTKDQLTSRPSYTLFRPESPIMNALNQRKPVFNVEDCMIINGKEKTFLFDLQPSSASDEDDYVLLELKPIEEINKVTATHLSQNAPFTYSNIIGNGAALQKAIAKSKQFSQTSENILLIGASGTGKELLAQAIHNNSRGNGPFVAVNCASIPRELIESELFGYEAGSFTGAASKGKRGKIELANGGTLFLDEIGDMPIEHQKVLLRVLQDKKVTRIGSNTSKEVDFRLIAATNRNLEKAVEENLFREDLFYRLSVLTINLPSLKEHKEDIPLLCSHFIERYSKKMGIDIVTIDDKAMNVLLNYSWPGNIRELENTIIYAINSSTNSVITVSELPSRILASINNQLDTQDLHNQTKVKKVKDYEYVAIMDALKQTNNNIRQAAAILGMNKSTLYRKLRAMNMYPLRSSDS